MATYLLAAAHCASLGGQQDYYKKISSLYKAETVYEGRLKVILLQQVSSYDFEPTFIILVLICRILPDQPK